MTVCLLVACFTPVICWKVCYTTSVMPCLSREMFSITEKGKVCVLRWRFYIPWNVLRLTWSYFTAFSQIWLLTLWVGHTGTGIKKFPLPSYLSWSIYYFHLPVLMGLKKVVNIANMYNKQKWPSSRGRLPYRGWSVIRVAFRSVMCVGFHYFVILKYC